jgi:hypothetical protein
MTNLNEQLSQATLVYWQVSLAYNRRREAGNISVQKALQVLNNWTSSSDVVWKRVHYKMATLQENIIQGKPKAATRK